jgi:hypothetical protein
VSYSKHLEHVPLSILDGSDGELIVQFEFRAGTPPSGLSGPPENYDPGEGDEFVIGRCCYDTAPQIPVGLGEHEEERVIDWLNENWDRPYDGPDEDWLRDMRRDDELLGRAEERGQ